MATEALAVIGCGNLNRRDDGLGVIVAQRLMQWLNAEPQENIQVYDAGTGGMDVMFQARGTSSLILVDASLSGSTPGSIFKLPGKEVASRPEPGYSLHDFRWDHALYAGRKIFGDTFPHDVTVYLVEAADVSLGLELSPAVAQALERVIDQIKEDIRERSTRLRSGQRAPCSDEPVTERSEDHPQVTIRQGSIYIDAKVYAKYLGGLESIVLLRQDQKLLLLPVRHAAAGGLLLKVRNPQGDRVVHAQEFLRGHGIEDQQEKVVPVQWDSRMAALVTDWPS
ncbi:Putative hydrogenase maturation protease (Modular protein) [Nitrospira defluvii]|uniref:Hydrogenase maturation protease n=2 Tax=Nitrospira TaxID=1234 RepID=A0AA86MYV1_9BACT|nr:MULTISPECIES: hydrogenase maturation protease [Nitrospira]CAE6784426.1 Putative hydrogenase maturation protease (Modular protein) [Nitrospira defluvii]CAI4031581.1 putative hydrogenase maturation protease [Nitrospira tepida]